MLAVKARWLDADAAAAYLSLRTDRFQRLVRSGMIPTGSCVLGERSARWSADALDALMDEGEKAQTNGKAQAYAEKLEAEARSRRSAQAR
jgi:hypothetical protein